MDIVVYATFDVPPQDDRFPRGPLVVLAFSIVAMVILGYINACTSEPQPSPTRTSQTPILPPERQELWSQDDWQLFYQQNGIHAGPPALIP